MARPDKQIVRYGKEGQKIVDERIKDGLSVSRAENTILEIGDIDAERFKVAAVIFADGKPVISVNDVKCGYGEFIIETFPKVQGVAKLHFMTKGQLIEMADILKKTAKSLK